MVLLDTKPLTELLLHCMGLKSSYGKELRGALHGLKFRCSSLWPVFTETMYFVYRDLGKRKFSKLLEIAKRCLCDVSEIGLRLHEALEDLEPSFDLADAALLRALKRYPLTVLVSEDRRLVEKARKIGATVLTPWEIITLAPKGGEE